MVLELLKVKVELSERRSVSEHRLAYSIYLDKKLLESRSTNILTNFLGFGLDGYRLDLDSLDSRSNLDLNLMSKVKKDSNINM